MFDNAGLFLGYNYGTDQVRRMLIGKEDIEPGLNEYVKDLLIEDGVRFDKGLELGAIFRALSDDEQSFFQRLTEEWSSNRHIRGVAKDFPESALYYAALVASRRFFDTINPSETYTELEDEFIADRIILQDLHDRYSQVFAKYGDVSNQTFCIRRNVDKKILNLKVKSAI